MEKADAAAPHEFASGDRLEAFRGGRPQKGTVYDSEPDELWVRWDDGGGAIALDLLQRDCALKADWPWKGEGQPNPRRFGTDAQDLVDMMIRVTAGPHRCRELERFLADEGKLFRSTFRRLLQAALDFQARRQAET